MSGLVQPLWLVTGYGTMAGSLWTTLPTVPIRYPMISIHLDPEAPGWQTVLTDADMKQIFASWLQALVPQGDKC